MNSIKTNLLKKRGVSKKQEPAFTSTGVHITERVSRQPQTYQSISGYMTIHALPPSRGAKNLSLEPVIQRFKITKEDMLTSPKITPQDFKLTRPTTTIVNLEGRKPTEYVDLGCIVDDEREYDDIAGEKVHHKLANIFPPKHEVQESEEDQYMGKINEFIKEAFEGKDYRVSLDFNLD
jgi:hypothetical protein